MKERKNPIQYRPKAHPLVFNYISYNTTHANNGKQVCSCLFSKNLSQIPKSRSEQAPGSAFHPRDENGKIYCDFLGPFRCNIKVDPER